MELLAQDPMLQGVLAACSRSLKATATALFPERFTRPFSSLHRELFRYIDDPSIQRLVIAAPRGFGKTSIVNLALPAKALLFREKKFIVPVSCSSSSAEMQSENLKLELKTNAMIRKLFGQIEPESRDHPFGKEFWTTPWGSAVMPRGRGQQVRGLLYGNYRPDLIIVDDLEDSEEVRSEEQRAKVKQWFFSDLCNAIDRGSKDWKIIVIGTVLHEAGLLEELLKDENWASIRLSLCDDQYKSFWPDYMSDAEVLTLVNQYKKQGLLDVFYREFRNMAVATEDACFTQHMFHPYDETKIDKKQLETFIIVDPAKSVKLHSADSALLAWGIDVENRRILIRDAVSEKLRPDQLYERMFNMADYWKAHTVAYEVTGLDDYITYPIRDFMLRTGRSVVLRELRAKGKKEDRIAWLAPFYRQGIIHHNPAVCGALEAQLLSFPASEKWDLMDCAAYGILLMQEGGHYPDFLDNGRDYVENAEDEDLVMQDLGSWRCI